MKKIAIGLLLIAMFTVTVASYQPKAEAKAVGAGVIGNVTIGQNSQVYFKVMNNSGMSLRNFVIWIPQNYTINGPGHNKLLRDKNYGPWSTVYAPSGRSLRNGYNAVWYKATQGTKAIPQGGWEKFPLLLKTPTNVRMYPQNVKVYWQADNGYGQYFRGTTTLHVRN